MKPGLFVVCFHLCCYLGLCFTHKGAGVLEGCSARQRRPGLVLTVREGRTAGSLACPQGHRHCPGPLDILCPLYIIISLQVSRPGQVLAVSPRRPHLKARAPEPRRAWPLSAHSPGVHTGSCPPSCLCASLCMRVCTCVSFFKTENTKITTIRDIIFIELSSQFSSVQI